MAEDLKKIPINLTNVKSQIDTYLNQFNELRSLNMTWSFAVDNAKRWFSRVESCQAYHQYVPIAELGRGGNSVISSAGKLSYGMVTDEDKYLLKVSPLENNIDLERAIREVIIGYVMGQNDVSPKVYDAWLCYSQDDILHLFLIQERLYGDTLYNWYVAKYAPTWEEYERKGPYPELCSLLQQQVEKMHQLGVIHNDLHGNNLYLTEEPLNVKILDFGLSQTWPDIVKQIQEHALPSISQEELHKKAQTLWQKKGNLVSLV